MTPVYPSLSTFVLFLARSRHASSAITLQADGLHKDIAETAAAYSGWAMDVGREVPANALTELKPVHPGVQTTSSLAVVFERMGATYSSDSVLEGSQGGDRYRD